MSEYTRKRLNLPFTLLVAAVLAFTSMSFSVAKAADELEPGHFEGDGHDHTGLIEVEIIPGSGGDVPETDEISDVIDGLQTQIGRKKDQISAMKKQMDAYQRAIVEKREEAATLANSLALLDNKIAKTELDIAATGLEIEQTNLEIAEIEEQIREKTLKVMNQRRMIGEFIRQLHKTDQKTSVDLFLTEQTISDFFNDVQFLEDSQRELTASVITVKGLKADLEQREVAMTSKRSHLEEINVKLTADKEVLDEEKGTKVVLADQVRTTEARYQNELQALKREVAASNADISQIETRLRKTLDAQRLKKISGEPGNWGWPVDPGRGITTYFHDPEYPFRYVYEHPGIDVRAAQGTAIRAAKGGYVARAKDAGMGYSYIMLVHDGDFSTVYGHVSKILVKEDTYIEKGDIIGLSGATPGTPGAGKLTTGPHLHFEFRLAGIPVNPLGYLPGL